MIPQGLVWGVRPASSEGKISRDFDSKAPASGVLTLWWESSGGLKLGSEFVKNGFIECR